MHRGLNLLAFLFTISLLFFETEALLVRHERQLFRPATLNQFKPTTLSKPIHLGGCLAHSILEIRGGRLKLLVKSISGRTVPVDVDENASIDELKHKIQNLEGIPPDRQRLVFLGKQLESSASVSSSGLQNSSVIHLVMRLRGGEDASSIPPFNLSLVDINQLNSLQKRLKFSRTHPVSYGGSLLHNPIVNLAMSLVISLVLANVIERAKTWIGLPKIMEWLKSGLQWLKSKVF